MLFREAELDEKLRLIQEYDQMSVKDRKVWRNQHRADIAILTYYRTKYLNKPIPTVALVKHAPVIDVEAIPVRDEFSLGDAITAFEVKRDHMNEFIEDLKRMRRGGARR